DARTHVMQLVDVYRARIVDVSPESLVIETTGTEDKIDSLVEVLRPYGVVEMVRTGRVALMRGLAPVRRSGAKPADDTAPDAGRVVGEVRQVAQWADVVMILIPDHLQGKIYREEIEPNLQPGNMLMFAHGFNIRFGAIAPRADLDVAMVAPKSPGHRVRELF